MHLTRVFNIIVLVSSLALLLYLATFQIGNADFWWHIKAGQLMRETGSMIHTDPFAYTMVGEPYLATQSWLAQVILSVVFDYGGVMGMTILRWLLVAAAFLVILSIDRKNIWITAPFTLLAFVSARPGFTDRPQLFTFLFFAIFLALCFHFLDADDRTRKKILFASPLLLILWTNLHGAASVMGILLFGALLLNILRTTFDLRHTIYTIRYTIYTILALCLAFLLTPNGIHNITYVTSLMNDRTTQFIAEWQPSKPYIYWPLFRWLWIVSIAAIIVSRKNWLFSVVVLLGLGYLSRTAQRHEMLFALTASSVTIYQLKHCVQWQKLLDQILKRTWIAIPLVILILISTGRYTYTHAYDINRKDHLYGIGIFEPGRNAFGFVEDVAGNMFNNYHSGGELLYRGYPNHLVFLDGRNVDYGYEYMNTAIEAGMDLDGWNDLAATYNFTHAVVYYDLQATQDPLPYTDLLDAHPDWILTYLDDWYVVYLKDIPENQERIEEFRFDSITPKNLERQFIPAETTVRALQELEHDLLRVVSQRPDNIKARLHLARLYMMTGVYSAALAQLEAALYSQPHRHQIYTLLALLAMEQEQWSKAGAAFEQAISEAGFSAMEFNYAAIAEVFGKAGDKEKEAYYRKLSVR